jgi:hypothetical protein
MFIEELGRELTGRVLDIWRGHDDSGAPIQMDARKLAGLRHYIRTGGVPVTRQTAAGKTVTTLSKPVRPCGCGKRKPTQDTVTVNHGAGGLGDALLGACAVAGLAREQPDARIVYRVHPDAIPYVRLLDCGACEVRRHDFDWNKDAPPATKDRQMNVGYNTSEVKARCPLPRWTRYAMNIGAGGCVLPTVRDRAALVELGADFAGAVVLSPFSSFVDREWNQLYWLELVRELEVNGYRVVVLAKDTKRTDPYKCQKVIGAAPDMVAGVLLNAVAVVGNDSGIAHLAGIMGCPTVVLCGQTTGKDIFGFYPRVTVIQGKLPCDGCWWQAPYHSSTCSPQCPSMAQITPAEVRHQVDQHNPLKIDLVSGDRYEVIRGAVRATAGVPGVLAEFGCYRGGTARVVCQAAPGEVVHLWDTFAGLPHDDEFPGGHKRGEFCCPLETVKSNLKGLPVEYHPGVIPDSLAGHEDKRFRFVHLDLDLMAPTRAALEWVWPRMSPGGRIVLDDYCDNPRTRGVAVAVAEVLPGVEVHRDAFGQGWVEKG